MYDFFYNYPLEIDIHRKMKIHLAEFSKFFAWQNFPFRKTDINNPIPIVVLRKLAQ